MSDNKKVELYQDDAGQFRWRRWASSDKVAASGEGYVNKAEAHFHAAIEAEAHESEFVDLTEEGEL